MAARPRRARAAHAPPARCGPVLMATAARGHRDMPAGLHEGSVLRCRYPRPPSPRSRGGFSSVRQQFCPAGLGVSSSVLAEGRAFAGSFPGRAAFPDVPCLERLAVWHWQQLRPRWLLSQSDLLLLSKAWRRERGEGPGPYAPAVPELRPLPFLMEAAAWRGAGRVRTDGVGPGHPQTPRTPEPDVSQRPAPAAPGSVAFSLD